MKEQTVPINSLCQVLNLGERRVQQMVKEGILTKEERGRYPFLTNIKNYVLYLQAPSTVFGLILIRPILIIALTLWIIVRQCGLSYCIWIDGLLRRLCLLAMTVIGLVLFLA